MPPNLCCRQCLVVTVTIGTICLSASRLPAPIIGESPSPTAAPTNPSVTLQVVPPGYQQNKELRLPGSINRKEIASDTFPDTPLGRYQKIVYDAVASRWDLHMAESADLVSVGTARISCIITPSGRTKDLKVIQNSSNEAFAKVCLRSILEVQLPPIPGNVASVLPRQGLSWEIWFTSSGLEDNADHWLFEFEIGSQKPLGSPDDVRSIQLLVAEARHATNSAPISDVIVRWKSAFQAITRVDFVDASRGALLFVLEKKETNWLIVRKYHVRKDAR